MRWQEAARPALQSYWWVYRGPTWTCLVIACLLSASTFAVTPGVALAGSWDSWLKEKADELYDDAKEAIGGGEPSEGTPNVGQQKEPGEATSPQPVEPAATGQGTTPQPVATPSVPQQPIQPAADTPRFDKPWVTEIQTHLTSLGYNPGPVDGAFGDKSQQAITVFQQQRGDRVTGLPTPSVMAALRSDYEAASQVAAQATPQVTAQATPQSAAQVSTAAPSSVSPIYVAEDLKPLATSAGKYAAWADVCGDPAGAEVRSDFLARAELLAPADQAGIIQQFEKRYSKKKKNAEPLLEKCILQGKTDCCTVGPEIARPFDFAKNLYESHLANLAVTAAPAESSGPAADSAAAVPAPTVSSVSNKESVAAAPKSPTPSAPLPASSHIPATRSALDRLYDDGGIYAGWAAACDEPVTVKQDYLAAANSLAPVYRDQRIEWFDSFYSTAFDRVKRMQAAMLSEPGTRGPGAPDPCTRDNLDHYKEIYETILLAVQRAWRQIHRAVDIAGTRQSVPLPARRPPQRLGPSL